MPSSSPSLILKIQCPDQVGIVEQITAIVAKHNGNLTQVSQFADTINKWFFARFEVQISDENSKHLQDDFKDLAAKLQAEWDFRSIPYRMKTAILVTKANHCLQEILWRNQTGEYPIEITSVIANHFECQSLVESSGIKFHYIDELKAGCSAEDKKLGFSKIDEILTQEQTELAILARFMQIIPQDMCEKYKGKLINIHHSLLPAFIGANPYQQAYDRGVKFIGATCHYVTADLDAGPIIEQEIRRVTHNYTPEDLRLLGRECERIALANGIEYHVNDRTLIKGNKAIVFSK